MALNSINTNIAAYSAQSNIGMASRSSSSSIARLSSGDRIVRAADDVAAMSAGTSLRTNVTTLRMAQVNTAQGESLLQVADGALSQITDILQRQKAIAVQAGAGSLTEAERGFLNQEFSNLTAEIDRLAGETNFNGVTLLDGSLFEKTVLETEADIATQATGSLTFATTLANGNSVHLNGAIFTATTGTTGGNTEFLIGNTIAETVQNLANVLNASTNTNISVASYEAVGNTLTITSRQGGLAGETYTIRQASSTANAFTTAGRLQETAGIFALQGADQIGFAGGDIDGLGTIGDSIINTQSQVNSEVELAFSNLTTQTAINSAFIGNDFRVTAGQGGANFIDFDFISADATAADNTQINVGTTVEETLDNFVSVYNQYVGSDDYGARQTEARREGRSVFLESLTSGNVNTIDGNAMTIVAAGANLVAEVSISNGGAFNNGVDTGINTVGVSNDAFIGEVQGFSAEFTGIANSVNISIEVGDRTYSASGVNASADATIRLTSAEGDFFDIDLQGATNSITIADQSAADTLASRLDVAFSTITFTQDREVASYNAAGDIVTDGVVTGSLTGSSFSLRTADYSDPRISDVRISSPLEGADSGIIEFDVNGVTYRSAGDIGDEIGANSVTRFVSLENGNDILTFRNGATAIEFDNDAKAANLESVLLSAFGVGEGGDTIGFQVGVTTSDTLEISIGNVTTTSIYGGLELDVLTSENAAAASDQLDLAIDAVTSVRAEVGALQSRFGFASANIESSIQNQDAARGVLLDTDVAAESTSYATSQVQLQAGIAVLAQANQIPQNLLQLLG